MYTLVWMVPIYSHIIEIFILYFKCTFWKAAAIRPFSLGFMRMNRPWWIRTKWTNLIFIFYQVLIFLCLYMYFFSLVFLCGAATSTKLLAIPSIIMLCSFPCPVLSICCKVWILNIRLEAFFLFYTRSLLNLFSTRVPAYFRTV